MEKDKVIELLTKAGFASLYRNMLDTNSYLGSDVCKIEPKVLTEMCLKNSLYVKYFPKEKYFQLFEKKQNFKIGTNFKLAQSSVILILFLYENDTYQKFGMGSGTWAEICKFIDAENQEWGRPKYNSYEDLVRIIAQVKSIIMHILDEMN